MSNLRPANQLLVLEDRLLREIDGERGEGPGPWGQGTAIAQWSADEHSPRSPRADYVIRGPLGPRPDSPDAADGVDAGETLSELSAALEIAPSRVFVAVRHLPPALFQRGFRVARFEQGSVAEAAREALIWARHHGLTSAPAVSDSLFEVAVEQAHRTLRKNLVEQGFTAASLADNSLRAHDDNYASIWARDGVMTGLWTLCTGDPELRDGLRRTLETLGVHQTESGLIPTYVLLRTGEPHYTGLGGIAGVDAVLWWVIGVVRYCAHHGDRDFAERWVGPCEKAMAWLRALDSNHDDLLEVPESSDWMDLFPRSHNVLYSEVLWLRACSDHASLLESLGRDGSKWSQLARRVHDRILELFWPTGQQLMEAAATNAGRFAVGEGTYLLSHVTPFGYSWRCDVAANLLGALTGLLDDDRRERLFQFLWGVGIDQPFPVSCLYPAVQSGAEDWKDYFVVNFLNLPHHYHNGGIWPFVGGLWVRFLHLGGRSQLAREQLLRLAEACRMGSREEWEFNEWLHGTTGRAMGKRHQAWSAASFLRAHHCLQRPPSEAGFSENRDWRL